MGALTLVRRPFILSGDPNLIFEDLFGGGNIDLSKWTVTDTESKISVSGGNLVFSGGKTTPAWAGPALVSVKSWARQAGLTIEWQVTPGAINAKQTMGFTDGSLAADGLETHAIYISDNAFFYAIATSSSAPKLPFSYSAATSYWAGIVLKATGAYYYVSTDSRVTWKLLWIDSTVTTTPLYAFIESYNAALTASKVEVRQGNVLATILSASPGAPALTAGAELLTDPGLEAWTSSTDLTSYTEAIGGTSTVNQETTTVHTPAGSAARLDIDASNTQAYIQQAIVASVSQWVVIDSWIRSSSSEKTARIDYIGGGDAAGPNRDPGTTYTNYIQIMRVISTNPSIRFGRGSAASASLYYDDLSVKVLLFDQTGVLEYIGDAGVKAGIAKANITVAAGYHAGFVVCADSATAPTNSIWTYYDRTAGKAYLMKNTTELVASTVTYTAAAELRVVIVGPVTAAYIGLYYGGALQSTIQGPYDLSAYGTHCHALQTGASDTVASFTFDTGVGA